MQRRPELRDKPVAVCGSQEDRHGIVLTASYAAKPFGVKTGMAVWQAKQCCPNLVVLPPDMREYIRISRLARDIYEDYTDQIEPFGLDENWLDVTGSVGLFGSPMAMAREISDIVDLRAGHIAQDVGGPLLTGHPHLRFRDEHLDPVGDDNGAVHGPALHMAGLPVTDIERLPVHADDPPGEHRFGAEGGVNVVPPGPCPSQSR